MSTPAGRIAHVTPALTIGGAERLLQSLVIDAPSDHEVYVLKSDIGPIGRELVAAGVAVVPLGADSILSLPMALLRLRRLMAERPPRVAQGWLYHGNIAASLAAPDRTPVAFGIHAVNYKVRHEEYALRASIALSRQLASRAARIIYCADAARQSHEKSGYPPEQGEVIANGVDSARFRPDPSARGHLLAELGLPGDTLLLGYAGRFTPFKDLPNLAASVALIREARPKAHLVAFGNGLEPANAELAAILATHGIAGATTLLGGRNDTPRLMAGIDVLMLSSSDSEALPMAVLEAMSSGTPVAATRVGELPGLLAGLTRLAEPRNPRDLAELTLSLCGLPPHAPHRGLLRNRVANGYDLHATRAAYAAVWDKIANEISEKS